MKRKLLVLTLSLSMAGLVACQSQEKTATDADVNVIYIENQAETSAEADNPGDESEATDDAKENVAENAAENAAENVAENAAENVAENADETVDEVIDEAVDSLVDYQAFVGNYQDSVSQRASAVVTENDDMQSAHIEITWGNSAFSTYLWTMDVTFEDEKLVYSNGEKYEITSDEDGNEETLGVFIEMSGYFEWDGVTGNISWTGAEEEECQGCVFEKIQ